MNKQPLLFLNKNEERRLLSGHLWIYSNEVNVQKSPLNQFLVGQLVRVVSSSERDLGVAYLNPKTLLAARLLSRNPREIIDEAFFIKRIQSALRLRERYFKKPYYRLIFGESDRLPGVVVDRFDTVCVVQITTAGMENLKEIFLKALIHVLNPSGVLWRNDSGSRELEGLPRYVETAFGEIPDKLLMEENETRFYVSVQQGQKTGWFFDHRNNRAKLADYVANKKVLDVFCYTGGWGIQAARYEAEAVVCVDSSAMALALLNESAELNQVCIKTLEQDAFEALKKMQESREKFDVIVVDPPAFVKRKKDLREGIQAYRRINELALKLLTENGILFTASCSMHMSRDLLLDAVRQAALNAHSEIKIIEQLYQAPDHPIHPAIAETEYLKGFVVEKS